MFGEAWGKHASAFRVDADLFVGNSARRTYSSAVMRQAHRNYFAMNWKGSSDWTFARCLRLAHHEIGGKKDAFTFAQLEAEMRGLVKETEIALTCRQAETAGERLQTLGPA